MGAARPWASRRTCRCGPALIGGKYEAWRLRHSRPRRGPGIALLVGRAGWGLAVSLRTDRQRAAHAPARRRRYCGPDAAGAREHQGGARVRGKLTRPRGEVHGVPRGHPGLRGHERGVRHVFPEGSTRALDRGRERARGGRAGGDRGYRDGGLDRGRPRHRPLTVRVDIQMSRLGRPLGANTLPGRLEVQTNVWPSKDRLGCWSKAAELSGAPGFSGVDHGSFASRRVDTQRSARPSPPAGGPRWNQISFPSVRTVGAASLAAGSLSSERNTPGPAVSRSEERRVGKEWSSRGAPYHKKKKWKGQHVCGGGVRRSEAYDD